jgi:uncharacterized protein YdhG (YjbR/CyaY superfamily)
MAKRTYATVDEYLAAQPDAARTVLEKVRATIRKALPKAEEVISYQIPAYRLPGGIVVFFAGWKEHFSLYPATDGVLAAFKDRLAGYKISRGTIRFPLEKGAPIALIAGIARQRAKEVAERVAAKVKPAARPKRAAKAARRMPARSK